MMAKALFRTGLIGMAFTGAALAAPVAAQRYSEGYEFLKAVKERDGDVATTALNEPGTTVVNARDLVTGETALHIVTQRRDLVWIKFLAQRGANANIADKNGVTPLQIAANLGFIEGIEELLERGARIDVTNAAGETPLISAVHRRDIAMVRLLLEKGANPDHNDNSGRSARDYAMLMGGNSQMLEEIRKSDEKRKSSTPAQTYGPSF